MSEHSPAPWRIVRASEYTDDPEDNVKILSVVASDGATVLYTDSGYFKPSEANANLVSAAPDLLAACLSAHAYSDDDSGPAGRELRRRIEAAVNKARGPQ